MRPRCRTVSRERNTNLNKTKEGIRLFLTLIIASLVLASCVPTGGNGGGKRKSSTGASSDTSNGNEDTSNTPDTSGTPAYFQNGSITSSSNFNINADFEDFLYLRGSEVNNYIGQIDASGVQCLVTYFGSSTDKKILVAAAKPKFFYNFSTKTQEYYYLMEPANKTLNQTFCQKPGLLNFLSLAYSGSSYTFEIDAICPNCSFSTLLSDPVNLISSDGQALSASVNLSSLRLNLITENSSNPIDNGNDLFCSTSNECLSKGYDCCSLGQCVNDKQLKSGVDTTSEEYIQSLLDIQQNPANIYNYPNFYHICSVAVDPIATPTPRPDPGDEAAERFLTMESLYNCTTPVEGEMSLCRVQYEDVQNSGATEFETGADDRNFNSTYTGSNDLPLHSLYKVTYAGEDLFKDASIIKGMTIGPGGNGTGNDNVDDTQVINLSYTPAASAPNDTLEIVYKIDGSCEKISTSLGKCWKEYVQGQNLSRVDDHFPASNDFLLPYYADTNKTIKVEVDSTTRLQGTHWNLVQTTPARVEFTGTQLQVYDTQVVRIIYYVDLTSYPNVLLKKQESLERIKEMCQCADTDCSLEPEKDGNDNIIDYICKYPQPDVPEPPLQQTVLLDTKTVPHRYYDIEGVYQKDIDFDTPEQEGTEFKYTNNDLLKPNNADSYIGFNEIYGSFTALPTSAKPAQEVVVKKGKTYDIFVDEGIFSTCFFCGTDYYSNVAKMFPSNFLHKGGGFRPDETTQNPFSTKTYRKDDLLFGRACWVPATMIPWSHSAQSDRQQQRLRRLTAQHFLFSNGYQRDWYGFDYGSVIGSFDGVTWFSVGNQRRILASTNKLFLAVNAYFGDLTSQNSYKVVVQDATTVPSSGSTVTSDFESDGAECQQFHVCEVDSDCASQLGWDYVCESISTISSKWPSFDTNGSEIPGLEESKTLRSLFNASTGGTKRCVYRGRGSICKENYEVTDSSSSYTGTDKRSLHYCSNNNYCQAFIEGLPVELFNNKIARYGKSAKVQNASSTVTEDDLDIFGMGTRVLGRPYAWRATESIPTDAQGSLFNNNVNAICLPGRSPANDSLSSQHTSKPGTSFLGDVVNGIGMTPSSGNSDEYLSSCSIMDGDGDYLFKSLATSTSLSSSSFTNFSGAQAIPTNALKIFEGTALTGNSILKNFESEQIEEITLQENRCLRAPGSVCFSDMDCAPNNYISTKVATLNVDDTNITSELNKYEIQFWQEELVCSQEFKSDEEGFDITQNRCCRELGKTISIATATDTNGNLDIDVENIPSLSSRSLADQDRYFRYSTVWDLLQTDSANYKPAKVKAADSCPGDCGSFTDLDKQWNTIGETATRTCCTKHWIRNFDKDDNGGGHAWGPTKTQGIPKESFKCLNWSQCTSTVDPITNECGGSSTEGFFSCSHVDDPDDANCKAYRVPPSEADRIFEWTARLELVGIPQVPIHSEGHSDIQCRVDPTDQSNATPANTPPPNILAAGAGTEYLDGGENFLSGGDFTNFNGDNLKKIFSPDEMACCIPAGSELPDGESAELCCTGFVNSNSGRCQLPDFSNVSIYLNRYVSSAAQEEDDSLFDDTTGYIKNEADVIRIACDQNICASGRVRVGISLSELKYPGHENNPEEKRVRRFIDGDDEANNFSGLSDLYDEGLRWNNMVYCVPESIELPEVRDCN